MCWNHHYLKTYIYKILPPLSPWQESIPPPSTFPAHIIDEVRLLIPYFCWHSEKVIPGTSTWCRTFGADPEDESVPQPLAVKLFPARKSPPSSDVGRQARAARELIWTAFFKWTMAKSLLKLEGRLNWGWFTWRHFVWRVPSEELVTECSPTIISHLPPFTPVQWAAVRTCRAPIRVPPQNGVLEPRLTRATCHGREYGVASEPPTIRRGLIPQPNQNRLQYIESNFIYSCEKNHK